MPRSKKNAPKSSAKKKPKQRTVKQDSMADGDEMQNSWGVDYVLAVGHGRGGRRTFSGFSADISEQVKGFKLDCIAVSGTAANAMAMNLATGYDYSRVLIAVGSYVGGDEKLQSFSTSAYSARGRFAFPKAYEATPEHCRAQSVPLPYFIDCEGYDTSRQMELEDKCLSFLHRLLLLAVMIGRPYKVLLLEYMLGGCGGKLSKRFLEQLGHLLHQFKVCVIADEILTGARVGPTMCMTTNMPPAFIKVVMYITLGKWLSCALVLKKIPTKPVQLEETLRGYSTVWNCGPPSTVFQEVASRIEKGMIEKRRKQVLRLMRVENRKEHHWGGGVLIFTSLTRNPVMKGLNNRKLPRLDNSKLVKLNARPSEWTRTTACAQIVNTIEEWVVAKEISLQRSRFAFFDAVVCFALTLSATKAPVEFRPEDILEHMGQKKAEELAVVMRTRLREEDGRKSTKRASSFVKEAITTSIHNVTTSSSTFERVIYKKRKGWGRVEYTYVSEHFVMPHKVCSC